MEFKKCERCGCFFTTTDNVCQNCMPRDNFEISKLRNYINDNNNANSIQDLSINTGISVKNLNRYLNENEFSEVYDKLNLNNQQQGNISINL